jgi:cellulose synthase (UDP-forming)
MTSTLLRTVTSKTDSKTSYFLPSPPNDEEKLWYFGRQHLWLIGARTIAAAAAAISLALFSTTTPILWLFWPMLSIFALYMVLTHYTTTRKRSMTLAEHRATVTGWRPAQHPSVDIFLPCAGEDIEILRNTYLHVGGLRYPGEIRVHVLDDGDRVEVGESATEFGFGYHVRPDRPHMKKAGNLKYGFEHSGNQLIVIFDADFCPRSDFLDELVPYFEDPTIGIVQSPQFFDSNKRMGWLQSGAGAVQESFYRWAQPSRDKIGAPICVGTCAIYRRSALEVSGGFAQIGHSEDVHTGVNLLKVGFRTIYIPIVLAKGVCPDKLSSFISQQYRWCAGSMSLLVDQEFHDSPLTYRQRMCFFTGFGYYISTGVGVYLLSLPTLVMLWFLPDHIVLQNFFWMIPTFALYPFIAMVHKTRWTPSTLRIYTISSFSHAAAIWHVLRGRPAEWVPSGEVKKTSMTSRVMTGMIGWLVLSNTLMFAGVAKFLLDGRALINVFPLLAFAILNTYTWIPIATLAREERRARVSILAL